MQDIVILLGKMMYLAHIDHETKLEQPLAEHSTTVSELCKEYGKGIGSPNLAALCGFLHDTGKAKQEFQEYLKIDDPEIRKRYRGKINHSTAGAKYIFEKYGKSTDKFERYTSQLIALTICSHHSNLIDCIDMDGQDVFFKRLNPENEIYYQESLQGFRDECTPSEKLDDLFHKAADEVRVFNEKNSARSEVS